MADAVDGVAAAQGRPRARRVGGHRPAAALVPDDEAPRAAAAIGQQPQVAQIDRSVSPPAGQSRDAPSRS